MVLAGWCVARKRAPLQPPTKLTTMAFVQVGGDQTTKPTYFEVLAADKLVPSLRAALVYAISVFSQRRPWLHRVLDYEDEVLALVLLLVDWHSLNHMGATLAESLYGLRRRRVQRQQPPQQAMSQSPGAAAAPVDESMSAWQKHMSLLSEVLLPYIRSKAERQYKNLNSGVLGLALQRGVAVHAATPLSAMQAAPWGARARQLLSKAFVFSYPYAHAACELTSLGYHAAYLLGAAQCHRPVLHALDIQLARVSAQDLSRMHQERNMARRTAMAATRHPERPAWIGAAQRGALQMTYLLADHSRHALILTVFGFKALEWWFTTAEERLSASKTLPPPPPPPPPRPSPQGVGLPEDPSCCPVCKKQFVNPCQVSTSGYVGCYTCMFEYVRDQGCCPVTLVPCQIEHIRKLYTA